MHRRELIVGSATAFGSLLATVGLKANELATANIKRLLIDLGQRDDGIYSRYLNRDGSVTEVLLIGIASCSGGE